MDSMVEEGMGWDRAAFGVIKVAFDSVGIPPAK